MRMLDDMKVLSRIAPDLMADIGRRAQVLSSIESMQPVGRRALAARLNLPEREVRAAAERGVLVALATNDPGEEALADEIIALAGD